MTGPRPPSSSLLRRLDGGRRLLNIRRTAPQFHLKRTLDMAEDVSALETLILHVGEVTPSHFSGSGSPCKSQGLR